MGNILIVEDHPAAAGRLRQYIKHIDPGLETVVFAQAGEAYRFAKEHPVALFILDIQLADYKGTGLAKQLRRLPEYKYTPILFETALAGEELTTYRDLKCYGFLVKPFGEEEFASVFRDALGLSAHLQETAKRIEIRQKQFVLEYQVSDIVCVEAFGKKLVIHTNNRAMGAKRDVISGYTLAGLYRELGDETFVQCHKSYVVNRSFIERIDKTERMIYLRGMAHAVPIGNKYQPLLWGV